MSDETTEVLLKARYMPGDLVEVYPKDCGSKKWKLKVVSVHDGSNGRYKEQIIKSLGESLLDAQVARSGRCDSAALCVAEPRCLSMLLSMLVPEIARPKVADASGPAQGPLELGVGHPRRAL